MYITTNNKVKLNFVFRVCVITYRFAKNISKRFKTTGLYRTTAHYFYYIWNFLSYFIYCVNLFVMLSLNGRVKRLKYFFYLIYIDLQIWFIRNYKSICLLLNLKWFMISVINNYVSFNVINIIFYIKYIKMTLQTYIYIYIYIGIYNI